MKQRRNQRVLSDNLDVKLQSFREEYEARMEQGPASPQETQKYKELGEKNSHNLRA